MTSPAISLSKFGFLLPLIATLTVSCGGQVQTNVDPGTTEGNDSGRVVVGSTSKPRTIDPADSYEVAGLNIIYNVTETLYTYEVGTTELKPLLATAMPTISEDGLTYTIPLREGVKFHDGAAFNAEAMKFSLDRFITNGGKPSFLLSDAVDKVEVTGDYELTITLKKPFAAFTSLLAFAGTGAISPQSYEIGAGKFEPNTLVGTGPYRLAQYSTDTITLDPFAEYWGEAPQNKGIDIQIYDNNPANLFNSFRTGAVDLTASSLDPEQVKSLEKDVSAGKGQVLEVGGTSVSFMSLNRNQAPLDQKPVRQAIAAMLDRQLINDRVLNGQGEPLYSLIPKAFASYQPAFQTLYGDADGAKATELLAQAGFTPENPAVIEVWYPSGSTTRGVVASTLKALAEQQLGGALVFEPKTVEGTSFFGNIGKGSYQSALVDWYPDFLDPDNFLQPFVDCAEGSEEAGCINGGSQTQGSFYYNEKVNDLIDRERGESDPTKRAALFGELQSILAEDVPYIPLWQTKDYLFYQNDVKGVNLNPSQTIPFTLITKE